MTEEHIITMTISVSGYEPTGIGSASFQVHPGDVATTQLDLQSAAAQAGARAGKDWERQMGIS